MLITELPATELLRQLRATERAREPDEHAVSALRKELERRLTLAEPRPKKEEATPCK